jgi:hypothetical protein
MPTSFIKSFGEAPIACGKIGVMLLLLVVSWLRLPEELCAQDAGTLRTQSKKYEWRLIKPAGFDREIPVLIVDFEADGYRTYEFWENVAQEVQKRISSDHPGEKPRISFYGHGGLVSPEKAVEDDQWFVAAMGIGANMQVMVFPKFQFPETLWEGLNNLYDTAHAAVDLLTAISAFNTHGMTPSVAAFSNSVETLVKAGQLLQEGKLWDGYRDLSISEEVKKEVFFKHIVTFGALFPNFKISEKLLQRVQGKCVHVVPEEASKQVRGNFPVEGVENFPIQNAPKHGDWPKYDDSPEGRKSRQTLLETLAPLMAGTTPTKRDRDQNYDGWLDRVQEMRQQLENWVNALANDNTSPPDPKYWGTKLYLYVTDEILRLVQEDSHHPVDRRRFKHPEIVLHEVVLFMSLYLSNLETWQNGAREQVTIHWQAAFEEMERLGKKDPANALIAWIKAHIQGDLHRVLSEAYQFNKAKNPTLAFFDLLSDYEAVIPAFYRGIKSLHKDLALYPELRATLTLVELFFSGSLKEGLLGERGFALLKAVEEADEMGLLTPKDRRQLEMIRKARRERNDPKPYPPFFPPRGGGAGRVETMPGALPIVPQTPEWLEGGVRLEGQYQTIPDTTGMTDELGDKTLGSRPEAGAPVWEFEQSGQKYKAGRIRIR